MKNKMAEIVKKEVTEFGEKKISRKDAIKRAGYFALSASTMMILLSKPNQADGSSGPETSYTPPPSSNPPSSGRPKPRSPW